MQLRNLRDLMGQLPIDGKVRDTIRKFNLAPKVHGKAQSVKELAENLGFSVTQLDLPRGMAGRLMSDPFAENGYEIQVNRRLGTLAMRWAVLHEMGHYFLHIDRNDPLADPMYLDRSDNAFYVDVSEEREANQFAEVILFGDGSLAAARSLYADDMAKLVRHFGVSEAVLKIAMERY